MEEELTSERSSCLGGFRPLRRGKGAESLAVLVVSVQTDADQSLAVQEQRSVRACEQLRDRTLPDVAKAGVFSRDMFRTLRCVGVRAKREPRLQRTGLGADPESVPVRAENRAMVLCLRVQERQRRRDWEKKEQLLLMAGMRRRRRRRKHRGRKLLMGLGPPACDALRTDTALPFTVACDAAFTELVSRPLRSR